jgi:hypothetical protein
MAGALPPDMILLLAIAFLVMAGAATGAQVADALFDAFVANRDRR